MEEILYTQEVFNGSDYDILYPKTIVEQVQGAVSSAQYNPFNKTSEMTQEVGKDAQGKLWTKPAPQGSFLPLGGGTMTGAIAMGGNGITGLPTPTNDADAATMKYVIDRIKSGRTVEHSITRSISLKSIPVNGSVSVELSNPLTDYDVLILRWQVQRDSAQSAKYVLLKFDDGSPNQVIEWFTTGATEYFCRIEEIFIRTSGNVYSSLFYVHWLNDTSGELDEPKEYETLLSLQEITLAGGLTFTVQCAQGAGTSSNANNHLLIGGIKL